MPAHLNVGDKVKLTVRVKANSPTPPTGKLDLAILEHSNVLWSKTVNYNGGTKTVVARSLPKGNDYVATARFRPSDNTFKRCHDSTPFGVAATSNNHHHNGNNGGPGGLLPDTGGPAILWLLLGLGLVGGGTGAVVYARRKQDATPATV